MKNIILFPISTLLLFACGSKPQDQVAIADSLQANIITLTSLQYKASNITVGKLERRPVPQRINVNGKLDVPPQNLVIISTSRGLCKIHKLAVRHESEKRRCTGSS